LHNKVGKKEFRKSLRTNMTQPENMFWQAVRSRNLGVKFRRQHSIGAYVVDFYCAECGLVIEIDGDSHFSAEGMKYDEERSNYLRAARLEIVRYSNIEVMQQLNAVIDDLLQRVSERKKKSRFQRQTSPQPSP
jgi:very-short-patch-repair endonuclease